MPIRPEDLITGGALQGAVAASLLRARDAAAELLEGDQIGIYRIVREIGRGGMAIVYEAERADGEYQQRVALKWMLQAQPDATSEALFRRERQALADLRHPHIARLLDGGRSAEGRPWLAMELIDGEPLDHHAVQHALPQALRLQLFLQVCAAVAFAHARGVIHRDIKPSNVLVDSDGSAKLLDFGIAQLLGQDDELTLRAYTPGFASPEQVRGETLTVASDVYQLGRLLVSLLSRSVEQQRTLVDAVDTGNAHAPPWPGDTPVDLVAILQRATAFDPADRYATADAFAADIAAYLARRPVAARRGGGGYRLTRFLQRHPLAASASTLALALVIGGTLYFTQRLRIERDAASHQADVAEATLDFMRDDLLASADPEQGGDRNVTVRAAVDQASSGVDARFAEVPLERALIRITLAQLYVRLGEYAIAEREARSALAASGDDGGALAIRARVWLARALIEQRRYPETLAELPRVDVPLERVETEVLDDLLQAEGLRARCDIAAGRLDAAIYGFDRVYRVAVQRIGEHSGAARSALLNRATVLLRLGRQDEALEVFRHVNAIDVAQRGRDSPLELVSRGAVVAALNALRRYDEALVVARETLAARRKVLGDDHKDTIEALSLVGTILQEQLQYDDSAQAFEQVLAASRRLYGNTDQRTFSAINNLALLLSRAGRLEEAKRLFDERLAVRDGSVPPRDQIVVKHNYAGLLRRMERGDEAVPIHLENIAAAHELLGPDHPLLATLRSGYAASLESLDRFDEADEEWSAALALLERVQGPDNPGTLRLRGAYDKARAARAVAEVR